MPAYPRLLQCQPRDQLGKGSAAAGAHAAQFTACLKAEPAHFNAELKLDKGLVTINSLPASISAAPERKGSSGSLLLGVERRTGVTEHHRLVAVDEDPLVQHQLQGPAQHGLLHIPSRLGHVVGAEGGPMGSQSCSMMDLHPGSSVTPKWAVAPISLTPAIEGLTIGAGPMKAAGRSDGCWMSLRDRLPRSSGQHPHVPGQDHVIGW